MSELDPERRERLVERLDGGGQALITAADDELGAGAGERTARCAMPRGAGERLGRGRMSRDAARRARAAGDALRARARAGGPEDTAGRGPGGLGGGRRRARSPPSPSPVSERAGTVTVALSDPVWAEELELMQEQLLERLESASASRRRGALRFRVGRLAEISSTFYA